MRTAADSWHDAAVIMAANKTKGFDQTGFDFTKMAPISNGLWSEPDNAGGIAYQSLLAYHHTVTAYAIYHCLWLTGCSLPCSGMYSTSRNA